MSEFSNDILVMHSRAKNHISPGNNISHIVFDVLKQILTISLKFIDEKHPYLITLV